MSESSPPIASASDSASVVLEGLHRQAQRSDAPWYDRQADSWQAVVPPKPSENEGRSSSSGPFAAEGLLNVLGWGLLIGLVIMLVVGLVIAVMNAPQRERGEATDTPAPRKKIAEPRLRDLPVDLGNRDPRDVFQEARRDNNQALMVTALFAIVLLALHRGGIVRLRRGTTNREYLAACMVHSWQDYLYDLITRFEQVYFGGVGVSQDEVTALIQSSNTILRAIKQPELPQ